MTLDEITFERPVPATRHLLSVNDLDRDGILEIMRLSRRLRRGGRAADPEGARAPGPHRGDGVHGAVDPDAALLRDRRQAPLRRRDDLHRRHPRPR